MTQKHPWRWTVGVVLASLLLAVVYFYWRVNDALRGDYETIRVVQMVEDYVKMHDGHWPLSWEDLDGTETAKHLAPLDSSYFRRYTTVNFALTSEQLIANPTLIYDAVRPISGKYHVYPHARHDLDSVMQAIRDNCQIERTPPTRHEPSGQTTPEQRDGQEIGIAGLVSRMRTGLESVRPPLPPPKEQSEVAPLAERLAAQQVYLWNHAEARQRELAKMRRVNPEWDLMARSFFVWALANQCLRHPQQKAANLILMDRIIDDTTKAERERGFYYFLMPYAQDRAFVAQPPRSLFVDGEIALMLAARRLVEEKEAYRRPLQDRVQEMVRRMESGKVMCAESYPDECWMLCNTVALASIRLSDRIDGSDHATFFKKWLATAKEKLIDRRTGLLVSSFRLDGRPRQGPRGSSIWMAAHCLQLIDEKFATDQYRRAKQELGRNLLGMGYSREWPVSTKAAQDVDSGAVIPGLEASAGASGLALVGARAFDDRDYFRALQMSLGLVASPGERDGRLRYGASNQVGDAVILYASVLGPLWEEARKKSSVITPK